MSIGAFEHFGFDRYDDFFTFAYDALPADGVMLLHTILALHPDQVREKGIKLTPWRRRHLKTRSTRPVSNS